MAEREVQRQQLRWEEPLRRCRTGRGTTPAGRRGGDRGDGRMKPREQPVRRGMLLLLLLLINRLLAKGEALLTLPHDARRQRACEVVAHVRAVVQLLYLSAHAADRGRHDRARMLLLWVARAASRTDVAKQRQPQGLPQMRALLGRLLAGRPRPRLIRHDGCGRVRRPTAADVLPQVQQPVRQCLSGSSHLSC